MRAAQGRLRRALALFTAILLSGFAVIGLGLSPASAADEAVGDYGGCLVGQKQGDLLLLMDDSGSLETTDPSFARLTASGYLVDQLADVFGGQHVDLQVGVAAFGAVYEPVLGWTSLSGGGAASVKAAIDGLKTRPHGAQTDYWNGLNGARGALSDHKRATGQPNRCQAVVWFSDGGFNVKLTKGLYERHPEAREKSYAPGVDLRTPEGSASAERAALADFCNHGGLADQIRLGGTTLLAVGLTSGNTRATDFDTMSRIAMGTGCGSEAHPAGEFTPVDNFDQLLMAFNRIRPQAPGEDHRPLCQAAEASDCPSSSRYSFVLDESITGVNVLANAEDVADRPRVFLKGPKQTGWSELTGEHGQLKPNGSHYDWRSQRSVFVDLTRGSSAAGSWAGTWQLVMLDPAGGSSTAQISIEANVQPAWSAGQRDRLVSGDVAHLGFGLVDDAGKPIRSKTLLGTGSLRASFIPGGGQEQPIGGEIDTRTIDENQDLPLDLTHAAAGPATLRLALTLTTRAPDGGAGTVLTPRRIEIPVTVLPPPGYPPLRAVDFGHVTGTVDVTAPIQMTGPGCAWLPSGAAAHVVGAPQGLGTVTVSAAATTAAGCVRVAEGQTADLPIHLTTEAAGNGTLSGTIPVSTVPLDDPTRVRVTEVPFTADLAKPIEVTNFLAALIASLVLGPGIPLLLLAAAKWLTAKVPGEVLVAQRLALEVGREGVLRDGQPLAPREGDFKDLVPVEPRGSRRVDAAGLPLTARTGWSPFGAGFVEVAVPGASALSSTSPEPHGRRRVARLPLAVHNTWVALHHDGSPPGAVEVVVLAGLDPDGSRRRQLMEDLRTRLPQLMRLIVTPGEAPADGAGPSSSDRSPFAGFDQSGPRAATPGVFETPASAPPSTAAETSLRPVRGTDTTPRTAGPRQAAPGSSAEHTGGPGLGLAHERPAPEGQDWSFSFDDDAGPRP